MTGYDTNLAAEFYVMSALHRLGAAASLTLGNKKGVDVVVARAAGEAVTLEVKGVAKRYDWPANNLGSAAPERHFVILVSFEGQIADITMPPRCWVVPFTQMTPFMRQYSGRRNVSRAEILRSGGHFENAWYHVTGEPPV